MKLKVKTKTKGGPDGILSIFYINYCDELCYPLTQHFTFCFENNTLPDVWLKSFITPIKIKKNGYPV